MNPVDLIIKKRDGGILTQADIQAFVKGISDGTWQDDQTAAMLMAMFIRGLNDEETARLTLAMAASGEQFDLSAIPGVKVDKHSTGGVADTTTLILAPLMAACGVPVVKVSGRGLGFTGGTIDKLESIPGFRVALSQSEAIRQVSQCGLAILSQTDSLTPADRRLYALRDVTGTVDSIPLISASIMSKKIAAGADAIVLDVKCGNGAFMKSLDEAKSLARSMVAIGRQVGRRVTAVISAMDQPLGSHIGNTLEVMEALSILRGEAGGDLLDVALTLGSEMLVAGQAAPDEQTARRLLSRALSSGSGLDRFRMLLIAQGGDPAIIDDPSRLPQPACRQTVCATDSGYLSAIDTAGLGRLFVALGGGRLHKGDPIDYTAGMILAVRLGQYLDAGQPLAEVQGMDPDKVAEVCSLLPSCFTTSPRPVPPRPVVLDTLR